MAIYCEDTIYPALHFFSSARCTFQLPPADNSLVLVAVEREGRRWGRTRMRVIENLCSKTILEFVRDSIEPGSVIRTDGLSSYLALPLEGYVHDRVIQSQSTETASELLPGVHRVASLLKRWLSGKNILPEIVK